LFWLLFFFFFFLNSWNLKTVSNSVPPLDSSCQRGGLPPQLCAWVAVAKIVPCSKQRKNTLLRPSTQLVTLIRLWSLTRSTFLSCGQWCLTGLFSGTLDFKLHSVAHFHHPCGWHWFNPLRLLFLWPRWSLFWYWICLTFLLFCNQISEYLSKTSHLVDGWFFV